MSSEAIVFVVDDEPAMRNSLRRLFQSAGLAVQAYGSAQEFLDAYRPDAAGCLILDVRMPGMSGLELQKELAARNIKVPLIFLTGSADVSMAVEAMRAGAADFLEKPFDNEILLARARMALAQGARIQQDLGELAGIEQRLARLTPREREVMELMVAGKLSKTIADLLGASPRTIQIHRGRVMDKMQADSLADLVRMALLREKRHKE